MQIKRLLGRDLGFEDESGRRLRELLGNAGFTLIEHRILRDEPAELRALLESVADQDLADALVQRWRVPARFAYGALAALRLLPLLSADWHMIGRARRARGQHVAFLQDDRAPAL